MDSGFEKHKDDRQGIEKSLRILGIYDSLQRGKLLRKEELSQEYHVSGKSIQRDFDEIRAFLTQEGEKEGAVRELIYDREEQAYRLSLMDVGEFSREEILAIGKILLDSRAFQREEMFPILDKLLSQGSRTGQETAKKLLANERRHYIPPRHGKLLLDRIWELGKAIKDYELLEIRYRRLKDKELKERRVKPLALLFSEFYFYLLGEIVGLDREFLSKGRSISAMSPAIFRVDRIEELRHTKEYFPMPYKDRFEEGEFRKRVQFMYGGELRRIRFWYRGLSLESVLDRLPTAKVLEERDGAYLILAEAYGSGIEMWLRSQGNAVELLKEG